jgi:phage terminase large subunit-like protein
MAIGKAGLKSLKERWEALKQKVSNDTVLQNESEADKEARKARARVDFGFFVTYYFAKYATDKEGNVTECAPFHVREANVVKDNRYFKGVWEWFRGSAKSTTADIFLPLWLKIQTPREMNVMLLIGSNSTTATRLLQDVQLELETNARFIHDFGSQKLDGSWEDGEFQTVDGCAFVALGMGEKPRGTRFGANRPDLIICDDLDDDKMKRNPKRIRDAVDWLYRAVIPTMDFGMARFLLVNNRIAKKGILATVVAERSHWFHSKVNALDENGQPSWARYTVEFYAELKKDIGWKAFETEYQNDPQEDAGVFTLEQIQWIKPEDDWTKYDVIVMYGDMSYAVGPKSDFTAIPVWAKKGHQYIKLKAYVRQDATHGQAIDWWYRYYLSLAPTVRVKFRCFVEANATQKTLLQPELTKAARKYGIGQFIRLDTSKKGDKADRIGSMTTQYANGDVFYSVNEEDDTDMITSIEMLTGWEEGAKHDDSPDADQSAWSQLDKLKKISGSSEQRSGTYAKDNSRSF